MNSLLKYNQFNLPYSPSIKLKKTNCVIGFHLGSGSGMEIKRWDVENYYQVIEKLLEEKRNTEIFLFGGSRRTITFT